jgi:hypothetical protein
MTQTTGADQLRTAAARLNAAHASAARRTANLDLPPQPTPQQIRSQAVAQRFAAMDPQLQDLHFFAGWLMSTVPDAVDDALNAVETFRDRAKVAR